MPSIVLEDAYTAGTAISSITFHYSSGVPIGQYVLIILGDGYGWGGDISSATDAAGNVYNMVDVGGEVGGNGDIAAYFCKVAHAINAGDALVLDFPNSWYSFKVLGVSFDEHTLIFNSLQDQGAHGGASLAVTATPAAGDLLVAVAVAQADLGQDPGNGWSSLVAGGTNSSDDNELCVAYQTAASSTDVTYDPRVSSSTGYGASAIFVFGPTAPPPPPPPPQSPVTTVSPNEHWQAIANVPLGYYIHKGSVYLTGAVQALTNQVGSFRTVYDQLPAEARPAAPVHLTLPLVRTGLPLLADPGLMPPTELAATMNPDGSLTLDDELWQYFLTAPSAAEYWYYLVYEYPDYPKGDPPKLPRYPNPFPCIVALGNAHWPLAHPQVDTYTPADLAAFLASNVTDDGAGYAPHGTRHHLAGAVIIENTPQETASSPTPTDATPITASIPFDIYPIAGHAITTVEHNGELWVADLDGEYLTLPQPFNWGKPPAGHAPWLVSSFPAPPPGNTSSDPSAMNYIGFSDLGVGVIDSGVSGVFDNSGPPKTNIEIFATLNIDEALAMVSPTPDWFELALFITFNGTWVDFGDGFVGAWEEVAQVEISSGPVAANVVGWGGLGGDHGHIAPAVRQYPSDTAWPAWTGPGPISWNWGFISFGALDPAWLWKTSEWPGGSFIFHPYVLPPNTWYHADIANCGLTLVPYWEMPDTGFVQAGDRIDLSITGWEGVKPSVILQPGVLRGGAGATAQLAHPPVHGQSFGAAQLKPAGSSVHVARDRNAGRGGASGHVAWPEPQHPGIP